MRRRPSNRPLAAALALGAVAAAAIGTTSAGFTSQAGSAANRVTAAPDFVAPQASAAVVGKSTPYLAGKVKQGGSYYVYANATDTGNPAAGIATITANVANVTTGQTSVALSAGSFSAQGVSYGYRSAALTANASLSEGPKSFTLTLADNASNSRTQTGFSVTVDNTAPAASDVQTANAGSNASLPEAGDTITFTTNDGLDPHSISSGWTGSALNCVVRILDNALLGLPLGNDRLVVYDSSNTTQLPLGEVDMGRNDYAGDGILGGGDAIFGASGTKSSMVMSGATITITLGTASGRPHDAAGSGTMTWSPSTTPTDGAANAMSSASRTETGSADPEF